MANVLKVNEQNSIQQLVTQGWSRRRIARELNLDRKTVRRYLEAAAKSPTISTPGSPEPPESKSPLSTPGEKGDVGLPMAMLEVEAGRPSLCDPHRQCIDCKLDAGLSAQRIYQDLVSAARTRRLPEEAREGSIASVTNFGPLGITWATPIPLPNETLIVGLGRGEKRPVWDEASGQFKPVSMAELTITFDHRIMDGGASGRLIQRMVTLLASPDSL